eukprot:TRINITY_DN10216_c1_g1_i1.p1 TRINITY_DN10216_c1_g1~~TRINITY_DN10216_c1_g1_i1.p1  ORF type:complete len:125 (+),score=12.69 TRINITY_DN10216_c1_g1_i1:125-499(+)
MTRPNLIVNFMFNPPQVKIIGPIKETTVEKLNSLFPRMTSTAQGTKTAPPKFIHESSPPHWCVRLIGQFCDQLGQSMLCLSLLDALEEEGGWVLKDTNAITMEDTDAIQQTTYEVLKFFFVKKI